MRRATGDGGRATENLVAKGVYNGDPLRRATCDVRRGTGDGGSNHLDPTSHVAETLATIFKFYCNMRRKYCKITVYLN